MGGFRTSLGSEKEEIKNYSVLNQLILEQKWPETFDYFIRIAEDKRIDVSQKCRFMVYAGQVAMYHNRNPEKGEVFRTTATSPTP